MKNFSLDLTGVKGFIATILIVISLIASVLGAVQGALPNTVETLGTSNFDAIALESGLTVGGSAALNGGAAITGSLTISGFTQYPVAYFGTDAVNGTMLAHGLRGAPTYPSCMVYNAGFLTAHVYISAANATSVTFGIFDTAGLPWTTPAVAVRCSAVYVP